MTQAYKYSILYFVLFSILLLGTSFMLFEEKIGLSISSILQYYQGNNEQFIMAKSNAGVLKVILPHIFAFGLFIMVVQHFLLFTDFKKAKQFVVLIYVSFTTAFLELVSPFFILQGFEVFAYVKLISFGLLEFVLLYTFALLFRSIFFKL